MSAMSNNQKVIEVISKFGMLSYMESLISSRIKKISLYSAFPITAAPNWSDKREIILVENPKPLIKLIAGKNGLN